MGVTMARTKIGLAELLAASRTSPPSPGVGTFSLCQSAGNRNLNRYCESAYSVVAASARASAGHAARVGEEHGPAETSRESLAHHALVIPGGASTAPRRVRR